MSDGIKIGAPGLDQMAILRAQQPAALADSVARPGAAKELSPELKALEEKRTKEAAEQFEALLLGQMFKEMWAASAPKEGLFGGSREEEFFRDMFNEALANDIATGQGLGIKELVGPELKGKK